MRDSDQNRCTWGGQGLAYRFHVSLLHDRHDITGVGLPFMCLTGILQEAQRRFALGMHLVEVTIGTMVSSMDGCPMVGARCGLVHMLSPAAPREAEAQPDEGCSPASHAMAGSAASSLTGQLKCQGFLVVSG